MAASRDDVMWTQERPSQLGWYWRAIQYRDKTWTVQIVRIKVGHSEPIVRFMADVPGEFLSSPRFDGDWWCPAQYPKLPEIV